MAIGPPVSSADALRRKTQATRVASKFKASGPGRAAPRPMYKPKQTQAKKPTIESKITEVKKQEDSPGFLEGIASATGLDDFYDEHVIPVVGRAFGAAYKNAKETYGLSLAAPAVGIGRSIADATGNAGGIDEAFDYAADNVRAAAGIARTKGWEPAKPKVKTAVDKGTNLAKKGAEAFDSAIRKTNEELESNVPAYEAVTSWASKNAVKPARDVVAEAVTHVTGSPVNKRLESASPEDRQFIYSSNDITMRDNERATAASPDQRDRWMEMARGNYGHPAWEGYRPPFDDSQLSKMSDYELVNAAYGTHTNAIGALWEAASEDLRKIGSIPAVLGAFGNQIDQANQKGDYRGLGNMAEFIAKQAFSTVDAVNKATLYAATGGKMGEYQPLVRALQTEPILTSLDVAGTATLYGKGATAALKTGGALSKTGAALSRVPGAARAGGAIARGAEAAAAVPVAGAPLRAAAATGRGLRNVADVKQVAVIDPELTKARALGEVEGATESPRVGVARVFTPQQSLMSQGFALLKGRLYSSNSPIVRKLTQRSADAETARFRAVLSHKAGVEGDRAVAPVASAMDELIKRDPQAFEALSYILSGADEIALEGRTPIRLTPQNRADQLDAAADGRMWERITYKTDKDGNQVVDSVAYRVADNAEDVIDEPGWTRLEVSPEESKSLRTNAEFFRNIDEAKIAEARKILESAFRESFGMVSPKRRAALYPGIEGPDATLEDFLKSLEVGNIQRLSEMGVGIRSNVRDLPGAAQGRVYERLGIRSPAEGALSRRTKGLEGVARVQDETVIRMSPQVSDEWRGIVRDILEEELGATQKSARSLSRKASKLAGAKRGENARDEVAQLIVERRLEVKKQKERLATLKTKAAKARAQTKIDEANADIKRLREEGAARKDLASAQKYEEDIVAALDDIDSVLDSLMRDAIESTDNPLGGLVFYPTVTRDAAQQITPSAALAGRAGARDMRNVWLGQIALLGDASDMTQFAGVLARNLRVPVAAYEFVTGITNYLSRTGAVVRFSDDPEVFAEQLRVLREIGYYDGADSEDYRFLVVNDRTGFLTNERVKQLGGTSSDRAGAKGVEEVGVDEVTINQILSDALDESIQQNFASLQGKRVIIIPTRRLDALRREIDAAKKAPGLMRRLTQKWVRITLSTLPRTPIANVVGSGFLGALGGGLRGYGPARQLVRGNNVPAELANSGVAGVFGTELAKTGPGASLNFLRRYMDYIYSYNVKGEDMGRLVVFARNAEEKLKNSAAAQQLRRDIQDAQELDAAMQKLLEQVALGKFDNGSPLTPELEQIRADALQKAEDFLGGAKGLTSQQRMITTFVPFWTWYKHIFKLYFYTLPAKYPVRSLTLNAMARLGYEESSRNGFYDSFYEDAIKLGEDTFGPNVYSTGLTTNIFPFTFGSVGESDEAFPGVEFALSSIAPTYTVPFRLATGSLPGAPLIGPNGERLNAGDWATPEYAEAAASELERLIAPIGLAQRTMTPRTSAIFNAYRAATGQGLPVQGQRNEGPAYAVTPRGVSGLGTARGLLEGAGRVFGFNVERTPVRGPVAQRRLIGKEKARQQESIDRYKEKMKERLKNQ